MKAAIVNSFLLVDQPTLIKPRNVTCTPFYSQRYRDEDEDTREDWFNPSYFDDPEDDDQDPETFNDEIYDDFEVEADPDNRESPPD